MNSRNQVRVRRPVFNGELATVGEDTDEDDSEAPFRPF